MYKRKGSRAHAREPYKVQKHGSCGDDVVANGTTKAIATLSQSQEPAYEYRRSTLVQQ